MLTRNLKDEILLQKLLGLSDEEASARLGMWYMYCDEVGEHISEYAVGQYGDFPNDPYTEQTIDTLWSHLDRYLARRKTGKRGEEDLKRDLLKIAHITSVIWAKQSGVEQMWQEVEVNPETAEADLDRLLSEVADNVSTTADTVDPGVQNLPEDGTTESK